MVQFPLNGANCRTGHKIQGRSLESIFVSSWNTSPGWAHVVLSRATTMAGVFLREALPVLRTVGLHPKLRAMHERFEALIIQRPIYEDDEFEV